MAFVSFIYGNSLEIKISAAGHKVVLEKRNKKADTAGSDLSNALTLRYILTSTFGTASDKFYTDTSVLILDANGASRSFYVFNPNNYKEFFHEMHNYTKDAFTASCSKDIKSERVNSSIKFTPNVIKGFNILHVFNEKETEPFDVLIIVK